MPGPNELDASLSALAEGQRVFGRYTLGRVLGRGTIGVVWLARDEEQRRNVELKFLPELLARDVVAVSDLRTEVERVRGLKHEAFQAIHDFHEGEGRAAVSSEFVPGNTLGALCEVRLNGCFDAAELLPWTEPLAEAFTQAHEQLHLVHRALHPGHLVLTPAGRVKVLDFGIAHTLLEAAARHSSDARSSAALTFSSPQLAAGALPGPADDIYALGATLYDLLAGAPPVFDSSTPRLPIAERRAVLNRWGAAIPPVWETAIAACLAHDPALRPASVAALIKTLREGFVAGPAAESVLLKIAAPKTGAEGAAAGASQPSAPTAPAPPSTKPSQPVAGAEPAAPVVSEVKAPARTTAPATPAAPIAMTLPEVEAANAITVQRAHHRGALVALICVGLAVWIARLVADRMLPPVLPEMKTPPHSVATAAPNSTATPATPVPLLADAAPPTRPPPEITPPVAPPVATPAPATPTPATPPPPPPATPMPATPAPATPVPTTPPPPPPAATPVPKPATPVPATPMPATPAPATPMPATPAPQPPPTTPAPKLATPMPATPPPATPIPATPPPPPPSATPAPNTPAAGPRRVEPVPSVEPPKAGEPWTNSLGMPFVPVPKLPVLVAIWETRSRDFATFAKAIALHWKPAKDGPDYPATDVSFLDAMLFCEWLTTAEEDAGRLKPGQHYRLPTDAEWSAAAGLAPERGESLRERDDSSDKSFPWGSAWPPPPTAGNFRGLNPAGAGDPGGPTGDTFARTAPVGSFPPNRLGLFDMAGNVAEMVSDLIAPELGLHATRGGSYLDGDRRTLRTRARGIGEDDHGHAPQIGFRVVLDPGKTN